MVEKGSAVEIPDTGKEYVKAFGNAVYLENLVRENWGGNVRFEQGPEMFATWPADQQMLEIARGAANGAYKALVFEKKQDPETGKACTIKNLEMARVLGDIVLAEKSKLLNREI